MCIQQACVPAHSDDLKSYGFVEGKYPHTKNRRQLICTKKLTSFSSLVSYSSEQILMVWISSYHKALLGARRDDELNPSSELTGELPIYHTASQPKKKLQ
jgi:hypothetical protein